MLLPVGRKNIGVITPGLKANDITGRLENESLLRGKSDLGHGCLRGPDILQQVGQLLVNVLEMDLLGSSFHRGLQFLDVNRLQQVVKGAVPESLERILI